MDKKGFSLMEVMITVVIIGILAAVAIPSYMGYVTRTRRADAVTALECVALYEEKARAESGSYVGEGALAAYGLKPYSGGQYVPSEYYDINIVNDASTFTATAVGKGSQKDDVTFAINQDGTVGRMNGATFVPDSNLWRSLRN